MATQKTTVDTSAWTQAGTNLKMTVLDGMIFLAIPVPTDKTKLPMTKDRVTPNGVKPSTNRQVATSHGSQSVPGHPEIKIGVNAYMPA